MKNSRNNAGLRFGGDKAVKADRTDSAFQKERARIRAANDEKTLRLRNLRLAKEARDREAAEVEKASQPVKAPKAKRKLAPAAEKVEGEAV